MKLVNLSKGLTVLYFVNLFFYSLFSFLEWESGERIFWLLRIPILVVLYFTASHKKQLFFFLALGLYQAASILFRMDGAYSLIYASISSLLFKFCLLFLTKDLICKSNKIAIGFAFLPFFVIYLYMINFVLEPLGESYFIWIVNAFVTSYIGGVSIINYLNNSEEHFFWLLLSSILFLIQIGAFFFNKFYIKNESIYQLVILSYGISHFTFCKFLLLKEQKSSVG